MLRGMGWLYDSNGHFDWRWIVTALVALYGAGIATYREYNSRREKRPHVKVMFFTSMVMMQGAHSSSCIQVRIENHGFSELSFDSNCTSLEWRGANGTRLLLWDGKVSNITSWPHRLSPGASFYLMSPAGDIKDTLNNMNVSENTDLRAIVSDGIGRQFFSNWAKLPSK
jgi:hypothetical protein